MKRITKARTPAARAVPVILQRVPARVQAALNDMLKAGRVPTLRTLLEHTRATTGRGCSLRDCHIVLKAHADEHARRELETVNAALRDVRRRCARLNVASRARVYRALNAHTWQEVAR